MITNLIKVDDNETKNWINRIISNIDEFSSVIHDDFGSAFLLFVQILLLVL